MQSYKSSGYPAGWLSETTTYDCSLEDTTIYCLYLKPFSWSPPRNFAMAFASQKLNGDRCGKRPKIITINVKTRSCEKNIKVSNVYYIYGAIGRWKIISTMFNRFDSIPERDGHIGTARRAALYVWHRVAKAVCCLLYTSDAADE